MSLTKHQPTVTVHIDKLGQIDIVQPLGAEAGNEASWLIVNDGQDDVLVWVHDFHRTKPDPGKKGPEKKTPSKNKDQTIIVPGKDKQTLKVKLDNCAKDEEYTYQICAYRGSEANCGKAPPAAPPWLEIY